MQPKPRAWWSCLALTTLALACRPTEPLPPRPTLRSLDELAVAWSSSSSEQGCRDRGPQVEYLGPALGAEHASGRCGNGHGHALGASGVDLSRRPGIARRG